MWITLKFKEGHLPADQEEFALNDIGFATETETPCTHNLVEPHSERSSFPKCQVNVCMTNFQVRVGTVFAWRWHNLSVGPLKWIERSMLIVLQSSTMCFD